MEYVPPKKLKRPFKRGDRVQVVDRMGVPFDTIHRVRYAGKRVVRIDDGRRYRASDGWWIGENGAWPFPSLTLAPNKY